MRQCATIMENRDSLEFETQSGGHLMLVEIEVAPKPAVAIAAIYGNDAADIESDAARQRGCETVVVMAGIDIDEAVTDTTTDIRLDHGVERKVDIGIGCGGAEIEII